MCRRNIDARHYSTTETLRNGLEVCVRAISPDDWDRVFEAFHRLDPESVYTRFFTYKKLSDNDLKTVRETGWPVTTKKEDGTVHVTMSLPAAPAG